MRKSQILLLFILFSLSVSAQQKIKFEYDAAGNQIKRLWCSSCSARMANQNEDSAEVKDNSFKKFLPEDTFSYYPNPVKEELHLKWQNVNDISISEIYVFSSTGALLKEFKNLDKLDSHTISFNEYPEGVYIINLKYSNEDEKSITIIK